MKLLAVDRLEELFTACERHGDAAPFNNPLRQLAPAPATTQLHADTAAVHRRFSALQRGTLELAQLHGAVLSMGGAGRRAAAAARAGTLLEALHAAKAEIDGMRMAAPGGLNDAEVRQRRLVAGSLLQHLAAHATAIDDLQGAHRADELAQVTHRVQLRFAPADCSAALPDEAAAAFARRLVAAHRQDHIFLLAREQLDDAARLNEEVALLHGDVSELCALTRDLHALVAVQQEGLGAVGKVGESTRRKVTRSVKHARAAKHHDEASCCVVQ
jgi:hypothetical protein